MADDEKLAWELEQEARASECPAWNSGINATRFLPTDAATRSSCVARSLLCR
jgi:hypothetical protein